MELSFSWQLAQLLQHLTAEKASHLDTFHGHFLCILRACIQRTERQCIVVCYSQISVIIVKKQKEEELQSSSLSLNPFPISRNYGVGQYHAQTPNVPEISTYFRIRSRQQFYVMAHGTFSPLCRQALGLKEQLYWGQKSVNFQMFVYQKNDRGENEDRLERKVYFSTSVTHRSARVHEVWRVNHPAHTGERAPTP